MTEQQAQEIIKMFDNAHEEWKGFILLPSHKGFDVFEIEKERLEIYLKLESMSKIQAPTGDKTDE